MVWARLALAAFVVAWLFGPAELRSAVPIWLPFLIAVGLELSFFRGAWRGETREVDRSPQTIDRQRYGYEELEDDCPPPRHPLRRLLAGVALIAALGAVVWWAGDRGGWNALDGTARAEAAARFSEEASRIVGRPVEIRCDEAREFVGAVQDADGLAVVGGHLAYLSPERCHDLYRLAFRGEVTFSQTARAIAVLAHEAWHLRGERDEGVTECYALQSGVELGRRLGLSEETARQVMRQQLVENRLRERGSFEYRVPPDCHDGGPLDLDPDSPGFP